MEIEIITRKENPLLERTEIDFKAKHANEATPSRDKIREKLSVVLDTKKELIVVDHMNSNYGIGETVGRAKAYKNLDKLKVVERDYILFRNKLKEKPAPGAKAAAAPAKK
ncbi:MAG: 30S ribosomal protein S24e [Candidatus Thermoplasmatota archaeon]|nr:30S ribosomal protein S24e [Candidatus Thermoplasmatota archaeon]